MKRVGWWGALMCALAASWPSHAQVIQQGALGGQLQLVTTVGAATGGGGANFGTSLSGTPRFLFIGEQTGKVRTLDFNQAGNPLSATNFLDVAAVLGTTFTSIPNTGNSERGLLGGAFHPDFNDSTKPGFRKFYTFTSEAFADTGPNAVHFQNPLEPSTASFVYNCQSVIREWTVGAPNAQGLLTVDTTIPSRAVMRIGKPGPFHNGGAIAFGPDNYLYISLGDGGGGSANGGNDGGNNSNYQGHTNPNNPDTPGGGYTGNGNAQDRRNIYGSIVRIKPTLDADPNTDASPIAGAGWRIPKSNPLTADTNAATPVAGWQDNWVDEIYAYGFRNPFRMSFDSTSGQLYAGDVGQDRNSFAREEVNRIVKGGNYGWVKKSGTEFNTNETAYPEPPGGLIDPLAQYRTLANNAGTNPAQPALSGGLAVIGGYVYRGSLNPGLQGKYVFGDLDRGNGTPRLLYTEVTGAGLNQVFDLAISGPVNAPASRLHGMAQDGFGELYYLFENGQVMKVVPVPEPSTSALALVALAGGLARRRRASRRRP